MNKETRTICSVYIPDNGVEALFDIDDMKEALSKVNEIFEEHDNLEAIYNYI